MTRLNKFKETFCYNPKTGALTNRISRGSRAPKGSTVGTPAGSNYKGDSPFSFWFLGRKHYVHRVAWAISYGYWPLEIDHIDRNPQNNRLDNLREVTRSENQRNQGIYKNNTSGVTGVYQTKKGYGRWYAQISINGITRSLGGYACQFDAICARKAAENKYNYHPNHGRPA